MNRSEILEAARQAVTVDRAATHGDAERTFGRIAAGLDEVVLGHAAAARADRVVMARTALLEHLESLIVAERKNLAQRQGASLGGEQEVL